MYITYDWIVLYDPVITFFIFFLIVLPWGILLARWIWR